MKISRITIWLLAASLIYTGCSKLPDPAVDPLPFPIVEDHDLTVSPGDDFFRYCNGGWIDRATIPDGKTIIGPVLYKESSLSDKAIIAESPLLSRIMADADAMYSKPEVSRAWVDQLIASIPEPSKTTTSEYAILLGQLVTKGVKGIIAYQPYIGESVIEISMLPLMTFFDDGRTAEEKKAAYNKEEGEKFLRLVAQGMGVNPDLVRIDNKVVSSYAIYLNTTPQALYDYILFIIDYVVGCFISEEDAERTESSKQGKLLETEAGLSYQINYTYAQMHVSDELKSKYILYCEELREQFRKRIVSLDWMSETTKSRALEKLDAMLFHVAKPDRWIEDALITEAEVDACSCFAEEFCLINAKFRKSTLAIVGMDKRDVSFDFYFSTGMLYEVNALYVPKVNYLIILPAVLLPPFVPEDMSEAFAYASMAIIGHEMTHGFDSEGAKYDKYGKLNNWWTVADQMAFEERYHLLIDCHNHLEIAPDLLPGVYSNGEHTLKENIADLGGVLIALDAYTDHLIKQGFSGSALEAQQRKFYEAYAYLFCSKYGEKHIEKMTKGSSPDVHSLPRERVNGVVMNTDLWYDLYKVTRNHHLYLPSERRTRIW